MSSLEVITLWFVQVVVVGGSMIALSHYFIIALCGLGKSGPKRRKPRRSLHYVFMVPCLNEELVVAATIDRLLRYPEKPVIWIIDDGSDDATPDIVQAYAMRNPRVRHMRRELPDARKGKGEALNACYRAIVQEYEQAGISLDDVITCVMDADGLLDANALKAVDGLFGDPQVGGAQITVRITNRATFRGLLQDIDFFIFGTIIQNGRNRIGSVGLGGNGQFTRLSALRALGDRPWSDCLTEDLELGLQLITRGWRLVFTNRAAVHQQGIVDVSKLVRQRTRWVQGYFQCWRRVPNVLHMRGAWYRKADLTYHLLWPAMTCLLFPFALLLSFVMTAVDIIQAPPQDQSWLVFALLTYFIAFVPGVMVAIYYRSVSGDISLGRTIVLAHLLPLYQFVWFAAGCRAVGRFAARQKGWAKTERVLIPADVVPVPSVPYPLGMSRDVPSSLADRAGVEAVPQQVAV